MKSRRYAGQLPLPFFTRSFPVASGFVAFDQRTPVVPARRINRTGRLCLEEDQVRREIERLHGTPDWRMLYWRAYSRLFWAPRSERRGLAEELQHEAVVKVLGPRPVPVGVSVIAALYQAVRGVAWAWRWERRLLESLETATVRTATGGRVLAQDALWHFALDHRGVRPSRLRCSTVGQGF